MSRRENARESAHASPHRARPAGSTRARPWPGRDPAPAPFAEAAMALSPEEWEAVRLSLIVAGRSVLVSLLPAVGVAWLLARGRFPGRVLLDALVHLPLVVPPVVTGWGLLMLF